MTEQERRILVVDDDDAIRALIDTVLRRRGLRVDTARNGIEALQRVHSCRYAVVLLDLMMPQMSGHQFLEELRGNPPAELPVIIVLTAGLVARAQLPEVVSASVRKPFDIEMLVDTVWSAANARPLRSQLDTCLDEGDPAAPKTN